MQKIVISMVYIFYHHLPLGLLIVPLRLKERLLWFIEGKYSTEKPPVAVCGESRKHGMAMGVSEGDLWLDP